MRYLSLFTLALAGTLAACGNPTSAGVNGSLTGQLGGQSWAGPASVEPGPTDGPTLYSRVRDDVGERTLAVILPQVLAPGVYPITAHQGWYSAVPRNGDAYYANAVEGTLTVTRVDDVTMRGSIEMTLEGPGGSILHFTNGEFLVSIGRRLAAH
jgi:hypothetical protein